MHALAAAWPSSVLVPRRLAKRMTLPRFRGDARAAHTRKLTPRTQNETIHAPCHTWPWPWPMGKVSEYVVKMKAKVVNV